jgi:2-methylcitrate dehydratase PrpD
MWLVTEQNLLALTSFVTDRRLSDLPPDVVERGCLIVADCIGCIVAGVAQPEVRRLLAVEQARGGEPRASVLGTAARLPADAAAFINGIGGTWHDLDEGNLHTRTHAMIQIVPAAFAAAEAGDLTGAALLEASILAYEASARIWRATSTRLAVHPHGTYGPMAAALALSKLRGDGPEAMANAASIAMTLGVAASRQTLGDGATVRNVYTGHSGRTGFLALDLRDAGFTGEHDAAASVFGAIYGDAFDPAQAVAELGDVWWIRKNYFKRFAYGRYVHGALDIAEALLVRLGSRMNAERISRIDIDTYFMAATMGQQSVRSAFGTRFSIPVAVASMIVRGIAPLTDDGAAAFADPAVHALAKRIFVKEVETLTAAYPACQPTRCKVTMTDGTVETQDADVILGESDRPFQPHVLRDKFTELSGSSWGTAAGGIWDRLGGLRDEASITSLASDLREAVHSAGETR